MTGYLAINVEGVPAPQGSKSATVRAGRAQMFDANKRTKPWRDDVRRTVEDRIRHTDHQTLTGPVHLDLTFHMPRPKGHYRTGRHAHQLRDDAPIWCTTKPDADKLTRAVMDALTEAGAYVDDSQVVRLIIKQLYANAAPGVAIILTNIGQEDPNPVPTGA